MTYQRKRTFAIVLILSGFIILPTVLAGYAISSFIIATQLDGGASLGMFSRLLLGPMGLIGVLGFLVGIPAGIVLFVHANKDLARELRGQEPYHSMPEDQFQFLMKPSWGAFFNAPAWAFCNKLYGWGVVALFVPIINLYAWLRLFADGRRMAWSQAGWHSFEQFRNRQKTAAWVVTGVIVLSLCLSVTIPILIRGSITEAILDSRGEDATEEISSDFGAELSGDQKQKVESLTSSVKTSLCSRYADPDADGLPNSVEKSIGTNGEVADTDGDGYKDLDEIKSGHDPIQTLAADVDSDGISDAIERSVWLSDYTKADTDGDGQNDLEEVKAGTAPVEMSHVPVEEFLAEFAKKNADARTRNNCE